MIYINLFNTKFGHAQYHGIIVIRFVFVLISLISASENIEIIFINILILLALLIHTLYGKYLPKKASPWQTAFSHLTKPQSSLRCQSFPITVDIH
jgi:hypothetical protein